MKYPRRLPVAISDKTKIEYGKELAIGFERVDNLEEQRKATNANFKSQIEGIVVAMRPIRSALKTGVEYEDVECDEQIDLDNNEVAIIRCDTNEVIDTRPITDADRQEGLPMDVEFEEKPESVDLENTEPAESTERPVEVKTPEQIQRERSEAEDKAFAQSEKSIFKGGN